MIFFSPLPLLPGPRLSLVLLLEFQQRQIAVAVVAVVAVATIAATTQLQSDEKCSHQAPLNQHGGSELEEHRAAPQLQLPTPHPTPPSSPPQLCIVGLLSRSVDSPVPYHSHSQLAIVHLTSSLTGPDSAYGGGQVEQGLSIHAERAPHPPQPPLGARLLERTVKPPHPQLQVPAGTHHLSPSPPVPPPQPLRPLGAPHHPPTGNITNNVPFEESVPARYTRPLKAPGARRPARGRPRRAASPAPSSPSDSPDPSSDDASLDDGYATAFTASVGDSSPRHM